MGETTDITDTLKAQYTALGIGEKPDMEMLLENEIFPLDVAMFLHRIDIVDQYPAANFRLAGSHGPATITVDKNMLSQAGDSYRILPADEVQEWYQHERDRAEDLNWPV